MVQELHKWQSPNLGKEMSVLRFGHGGRPYIVFPTSGGSLNEFKDFGMIGALAGLIDAGEVTIWCVESVDRESWYKKDRHIFDRMNVQEAYERYIGEEVQPLTSTFAHGNLPKLFGCSFGGFHAVNFALRHPERFAGALTMSGAYDVQDMLKGNWEDRCYYHLPFVYLPRLGPSWQLDLLRNRFFKLLTADDDSCKEQNFRLAGILGAKGIPNFCDSWGWPHHHDWDTWRAMAPLNF